MTAQSTPVSKCGGIDRRRKGGRQTSGGSATFVCCGGSNTENAAGQSPSARDITNQARGGGGTAVKPSSRLKNKSTSAGDASIDGKGDVLRQTDG